MNIADVTKSSQVARLKKLCFLLPSSDTEYNPTREETDEPEQDTQAYFAVVINGHSLVHALHPQMEQLFLDVSCQCE